MMVDLVVVEIVDYFATLGRAKDFRGMLSPFYRRHLQNDGRDSFLQENSVGPDDAV